MAKGCRDDRFSYLRELVTEFQDTNAEEAKEQVIANLANFGYDPQNYRHFKELNIVNLFLDHVDDKNETLVEFSIGGLCNVALDKDLRKLILKGGGVDKIIPCLSSTREETVLSAITTLMFLITPESKAEITIPVVIDCMLRFKSSSNRRLSNLASVFLTDYCTLRQIQAAKELSKQYQQQPISIEANIS